MVWRAFQSPEIRKYRGTPQEDYQGQETDGKCGMSEDLCNLYLEVINNSINFATSYIQIITMTYLNRFHKESVERCLRKVAESKSLQMNCEEEVRRIKEMHNQIAQRYPKGA